MTEFRIDRDQHIQRPLEEVFAFFADPENLSRITPSWVGFAIRTPPPIEMKTGALIDYAIRIRGIPMKWRSEITAWQPPYRFVDEQRTGPYRYWIHEHTFEERDGGTFVSDRVRYSVPGGTLIHRLFVARDLDRIFAHRERALEGIFAENRRSSVVGTK
jgi:ligand-binding SRPBCC domain-containing protein